MPNWCNNRLTVTAPSKKRLQEFVKAAKDTDTELSLQNLFPMPVELDIESGSTVDNGLAILEYQNGNPNSLHKILEYAWVKEAGISTFDGLIKYLVDEKRADVELAKRAMSNQEKHGFKDWYDWRTNHWGTKWDVSATTEMMNEKSVIYYFDSAWAPPIPAFIEIVAKWPDLKFELEYEEPGMAFCGTATFENGELIDDTYREMTIDDMKERGYYDAEDEETEEDEDA